MTPGMSQVDNDIIGIGIDRWIRSSGLFGLRPLKYTTSQQKVKGKPLSVIDLDKQPYEYTPQMHFEYQCSWAQGMIERAQMTYVESIECKRDYTTHGKFVPLYLNEQDLPYSERTSSVCLLSADQYKTEDLAKIFERQSIVIRQREPSNAEFNRAELETMTLLDKHIRIHDLSTPRSLMEPNIHLVRGTAQDVLDAHNAGPTDGKILKCLDLGLPMIGAVHHDLSTDTHATSVTGGYWTTDCKQLCALERFKGGLICSNDAYDYWQVDVNGMASRVLVRCGVKLWFLARPKPGCDFASTDFFLNTDISGTSSDEWDVEVVVLRAGDEIPYSSYMRPNTPHAVITPESAICQRVYFICYTTIRETSYGLFDSVTRNHTLTGMEEFNDTLFLIRRTVMYWAHIIPGNPAPQHSPDIKTMKGILDVFTACILVEIGNVLHSGFWNNSLKDSERVEIIEGRRLSRCL
ncbi:hypothetical protein BDN72DRAFT_865962, partial [Pluteus cervinus]